MRHNRNYGGLLGRIAIEEQAEELAAVTAAPEAPADNAESLETDLIEINDEAGAVDADEELIEVADDTAEALEAISNDLRVIAQNGGLNKSGAIMLNHALEAHYTRVGISMSSNTLATESFGGTGSRSDQTVLAAEAIDVNVKKIWESIVTWIQQMIQHVKDLFNKIFDGATKLKARAEKTIKTIAATKGDAKEKTFVKDGLAAALHVNGTVAQLGTTSANLAVTAKVINGSLVDAGIKGAEALLAALSSGNLDSLKTAAGVYQSTGTAVDKFESVGIKNPGEGLKVTKGQELPGGKALLSIVPESADAKPSAVAETRTKLGSFNTAVKPPEKAALPVLSLADADKVAKNVLAIADAVLSYKSKQNSVATLKSKIMAEAKKQANAPTEAPKDGAAPAEGKMSSSDARSLAKGACSMADQPAAAAAPYLVNTGKSMLDYVDLSLKQYGDKAAAPAAAAAEAPAAA